MDGGMISLILQQERGGGGSILESLSLINLNTHDVNLTVSFNNLLAASLRIHTEFQ